MSDSLYRIRASEVMCRKTVSVSPHETVQEALSLMEYNRVAALPVVDEQGKVVGMMTATDLIDLCRKMDDELHQLGGLSELSRDWLINKFSIEGEGRQVQEVMSSPVATVGPDTPLEIVVGELLRNQVHRLPVVDGESRLEGVISTTDVMKALQAAARDAHGEAAPDASKFVRHI